MRRRNPRRRTASILAEDITRASGSRVRRRVAQCKKATWSRCRLSGSGKSTLLRCINLLEVPDRARIVVRGEEIRLEASRGGARRRWTGVRSTASAHGFPWCFQSSTCGRTAPCWAHIIEAPVHVLGEPRAERPSAPKRSWRGSAFNDKRDVYRPSCPAASSSAAPSPGRLAHASRRDPL
jgi:polar amino acid transport system ATP-binding protein